MHSSTPDSENQSFLLSDNQNSSKFLALVQHIGCLSKERTPTYFTVLQSLKNNLSYQSVLVGLCLDNFCICQCLLPHTTNVWGGVFCLVGLGFLFFILIIIILWIGNVWIGQTQNTVDWNKAKEVCQTHFLLTDFLTFQEIHFLKFNVFLLSDITCTNLMGIEFGIHKHTCRK